MAGETVTEAVAAGRYEALSKERSEALRRARENALLTLPWLYPPEGSNEQTKLYRPVQTIGAVGTTRLASKMTTAMFPPNYPFFRHDAEEFAAIEAEATKPGTTADAVSKLAMYDRVLMRRMEALGDRPKIDLGNKHLLVGGNYCLDISQPKARVISMTSYVCSRDSSGTPVEAVIKEMVHPAALEEDVVALLGDETLATPEARAQSTKEYPLYTYMKLVSGTYTVHQEINGKAIPGTEYEKKQDELDYLFLRYTAVDGADWGRSYIDDLFGDLDTLEALQTSLVKAADAAAKVVWMVRPNGSTRARDLTKAKSGDVITGDANDVTTLKLDKNPDMAQARATAERIEDRLADRFLLRSSIQRSGERVTAEEIRTLAEELDAGLAGVYSLLSQEFQMPYLKVRKGSLKDLPKLPEDIVSPVISTGLEAMRRSQELQGLTTWTDVMGRAFGAQEVAKSVNKEAFGKRVAAATGVDPTDLLLTQEQVQQQQAAEGLTQAAMQAAPQAIQGAMSQ